MKIPIDTAFNVLNALADKTRLQIVEFLQDGEKIQGDIKDFIQKSQSTTSQHLKVLIDGGLLTYRQDAQQKYYKVKNTQVLDILAAVSRFISSQNKDRIDGISAQNVRDTLF
nr:metalloregulator ArsR/SmtB family transcription factor [Candidatus Sigynarchaeota archaeon]